MLNEMKSAFGGIKKLATIAAAAAILGFSATPVFAQANTNASCIGIEAEAISPPGSSDEVPGGMAQLAKIVKGFGGAPGTVFYSFFAKLHEGSHEACDA